MQLNSFLWLQFNLIQSDVLTFLSPNHYYTRQQIKESISSSTWKEEHYLFLYLLHPLWILKRIFPMTIYGQVKSYVTTEVSQYLLFSIIFRLYFLLMISFTLVVIFSLRNANEIWSNFTKSFYNSTEWLFFVLSQRKLSPWILYNKFPYCNSVTNSDSVTYKSRDGTAQKKQSIPNFLLKVSASVYHCSFQFWLYFSSYLIHILQQCISFSNCRHSLCISSFL